jgi:formate hydrogenlyase subunit 6/NADH:ubiquinone oxidoreductase subunit I/ferredoxin
MTRQDDTTSQGSRVDARPADAALGVVPPITLSVDGEEISCEAGETILEAARRVGIHIPTLCHEPRLPSPEACRICLVEVEGTDSMVPSCSTPVADGMVVHTDTDRVRKLRHLYLELLLSDHNSFCSPPCRDACPTHIKIPQFLDAVARGDYRRGMRVLREDLPFPAILGRVCLHPCEGQCRRKLVDEAVPICQLHGFMGEQSAGGEETEGLMLPTELRSDTGKSLAVVGAGPAGLACAFYARLEGHAVTVFEALPKPGGVLRYGIPRSRLPGEVLDQEFSVLWRMGIRLQSGTRLGVDLELADLTSRFDAVFLGLGDPEFSRLGIDDEYVGADFVINTKCTGCGLCARRCPVSCISGDKKELHVIDSTACIRCGTCRRVCKFDAVDVVAGAASGSAGGEVAETAGGRSTPDADVAEATTTHADERTFQTDDPRVFAGGDGAFGAQTVVDAVAQGKRAAWAIDAYLRGYDLRDVARRLAELQATPFYTALAAARDLDPRIERLAGIQPVFLDMAIGASPLELKSPSLSGGVASGQAGRGLTEAQARTEAGTCLDCYCPANGDCELQRYGIEYGVFKNRFKGNAVHDYPADFRHDFIMREPNRCIMCLRCVRVCRMEVGASCYDAIGRGWDTIVSTPDNLPLQTVGCISCGKCAETCPTGAIDVNRRVLDRYDLDESRCIFCGECVEVCPYDALEQTGFFELAGYSRTLLAGESLFVRRDRPGDGLRECVPDLVPHVREAVEGGGWQWTQVEGDGASLDEMERDL